ncbi:ATP synthase F1 subunit epsilon [Candidatus Saccharibacteria bacterium]|nr:ATP synthase F1 subunit epsilon [Candidatus Saccharibacteria bacterium]
MKLELITLAGIKVDQAVYEVMLPTAAGPISVFTGHEPLVSIAVPGAIIVRHAKGDADAKLEYFAVSGGVIEITGARVRVLVDEADHGDDIVEAESKAALAKALDLQKNAKDSVELERASQLVDRHQVRLNVAGLRRKQRR